MCWGYTMRGVDVCSREVGTSKESKSYYITEMGRMEVWIVLCVPIVYIWSHKTR